MVIYENKRYVIVFIKNDFTFSIVIVEKYQ